MLNTIKDISNLVQGSFLENREIRLIAIDESNLHAFVIEVDQAEAYDAVALMKSYIDLTKRYPLLTYGWGSDDFFNRFFYKDENVDSKLINTSPEAIMAQVPMVDLEAFLEEKRQMLCGQHLEESIDYSLELTTERFGACPDESEIRELIHNKTIQSEVDWEKWLFDWELNKFGNKSASAENEPTYLDWFTPSEKLTLMLLPTENSWDSLAYLHWFGACTVGTPVAISFLKKWDQQYEASLVCHYGTILQFDVGRLPFTAEEAFQLAWEQVAIAPCTTILPGVSIRDHARTLLSVNRWFLHERP